MSFLTAEWRKLAIANYAVQEEVLLPYLPAGTELDFWENKCYVSLIGFLFKNTRLKGIRIPFHSNFEEVNLRFYVRYQDEGTWKRGVVFVREIVPRYAISWVANTIYNENYVAVPMRHSWTETNDELVVDYHWRYKKQWQHISIHAGAELQEITVGSEAEFITEHYWGYARHSDKRTNAYEVIHPRWMQYAVTSYSINTDFALNYGERFAFLNQQEPDSVMLAEGSEVSVETKKVIYV